MTRNTGEFDRTYGADDSVLGDTGTARTEYNKIYIGVVKDNRDIQRMGRLKVWIPELSGNPDDQDRWYLCNYASPFAGATNVYLTKDGSKEAKDSQMSYGMWMVPPDLEVEVLVGFANGDSQRAFWFGCLYQQYMNHMVPGIPSNLSWQTGWESKTEERCDPINYLDTVVQPPVVEYNKKDDSLIPPDPTRPRFDPLYNAICQQGLYRDFVRGPTDAGARREAPSQIFGFLSPRGHQLYIDDGTINTDANGTPIIDGNQQQRKDDLGYIRLRTRSGTQILINDKNNYIYLNTGSGNTWMEMSDDSGFNFYTLKNFNIRAQGDFNLRVDGTSNFEFMGPTNWRNVQNLTYLIESQLHIHNENVTGCGNPEGIYIKTVGDYNVRADNAIRIDSGGIYHEKAGTEINEFAPKIYNNTRASEDAVLPRILNPIIAYDRKIEACCYPRTPIQCNSIIRQQNIITHEPWMGHPENKSGVGGDKAINSCINTPGNAPGSTAFQSAPAGAAAPRTSSLPLGPSGGPNTPQTDLPDQLGPGDADIADKIRRLCQENFPANQQNCSGFTRAVAKRLAISLAGTANDQVDFFSRTPGNGWTQVSAQGAQNSANQGFFVIGGLKGQEQAKPNVHGHVVVVVKGQLINGYPVAFWGSLGGTPGQNASVRLAWNPNTDLPRVRWYAIKVPSGDRADDTTNV